jgi:predicted XRE-type DNA-binding protein
MRVAKRHVGQEVAEGLRELKGGVTGRITHLVELSSGNVYSDLNLPKAETLLVKAELAAVIGSIITKRRLSEAKAGALLELTESGLSKLLQGDFQNITETQLIQYIIQLGHDVDVVVKPRTRSHREGRFSLVVM